KREVAEVAARVAPPPADLPKIASVAPAQPAAPAAVAPLEEQAKAASQDGAAQASPPPAAEPPAPAAAAPALPQPGQPAIGIDIGGSSTPALLNARWAAMKAHHGPLLLGLSPLALHERRPGRLPYRLVLGPLPDAAAA